MHPNRMVLAIGDNEFVLPPKPTAKNFFAVGFGYFAARFIYARRRRFTPATANNPKPIMAHVPGSGVVVVGGG
ncbi:MAG: hypothetical protein ABJB74_11645 [Gemmatimonas sp.]